MTGAEDVKVEEEWGGGNKNKWTAVLCQASAYLSVCDTVGWYVYLCGRWLKTESVQQAEMLLNKT